MDRFKALIERAIEYLRTGPVARTPGANPNAPPLPMLRPCTYSVVGHVAVVAFMLIGFAGRIEPDEPAFGTIAIDGIVLDDEAVQEEIRRLDELERAAVIEREQEVERLRRQIEEQEQRQARQEQELSALSSQTEEARRELSEQQTQASRQLSEMQQREQEGAERLERIERERQEEEERARAAAAERQRTEEETRRLAEEAQAAQRQLEETERRKREAELAERMRQEMEEERRREAIESGLLDEYKARIRQRIESNWQRPAGSGDDLMWVVLLDVLPGNEVAEIRFEQFNGTVIDQRSIETAIRKSSPLPAPPVPELFERQLRLRYPPPEGGS
ncbi:MAG: TonB C-terminal domain-containing protein [Gammaproteobacteria bacterium]|nr:TonB C-terminal domain-containing protein [Gammaproteobacteria bacterium]